MRPGLDRLFDLVDRYWKWVVVAAWLGFCAWFLFDRWNAIHWFALPDTDDNLRISQVRALLAGQDWYDLRQHRLNPPEGANIHWSRLVDLPIAGLILLLKPFVGGIDAQRAAVAIAPLIPLLGLFFGLVREADVFMENNAANVVEHLGIDYEQLSAVNPRLIMMRFPGFGIDGPYKHFKGYGATMEAVVGHSLLRGYADSDPSATPAVYHGDPNAGAHAAFAIQAALYARERTGTGQLIDMSQAEAVTHHISYDLLDYRFNGRANQHWGNRHPAMAPYGVFPAAAEDTFVAIAVDSDEAFAALCRVMGQPELASDARFADFVSRYEHQAELEPLVAAWTRQHGQRELMERLQAAGVMATMVYNQAELFDDPHLKERGFFVELDHPDVGSKPYPGPMAQFERMPLTPPRGPAPRLGQHNREVFQGILGLSDERIGQLEEAQIIGDAYLEDAKST